MENKYIIPRTRKILPVPCLWNGLTQTSEKTKEIHGVCLTKQYNYYGDGYFYSANIQKDWDNVGKYLSKRLINEEGYLENIYKKQLELGNNLKEFSVKIINEDLKSNDIKKLIGKYKTVYELWMDFDRTNVLPWFIGGDFYFNYLKKEIKKANNEINEEALLTLFTCPDLSFSAKEELEILKAAKSFKLNNIVKDSELRNLVKKYFWIPFGYDGPKIYDKHHYMNVIKDISKKQIDDINLKILRLKDYKKNIIKKQQNLFKKYKIPSKFIRLLDQFYTLTKMTDQRKEFAFQSHIAIDKIFKEISERLTIPYLVLKYINYDELEACYNNLEKLLKIYERRKREIFFIEFISGKPKFIYGNEASNIEKKLLIHSSKSEIKGKIANKGNSQNIKGNVRILFTPQELNKVSEGDILVTHMTTPEFVPGMRIAGAIVTDEGGVTCHAAIVSRELNKPCIIGTKTATKVLKDGDLVEVDTNKGVIRIIK